MPPSILLVEVAGLPHGVEADVQRIVDIGKAHGAGTVRIAQDEAERALLWKGRKNAFGAIARIKPNYYLHDTVVPRRRLPEVLRQVYEIVERHQLLVMNVFHAGDGNLHPLLVFDKREPGVMDRVHAAGEEIVRVSVAAGGVLSGEHGIGLEKRDFMSLMFTPGRPRCADPAASRVRHDRTWPTRTRSCRRRLRAPTCNTCRRVRGSDGVRRRGRHHRPGDHHRARHAWRSCRRCANRASAAGIEWIQADEMTLRCGAGTPVDDVDAALAEVGQCVALPPGGTVGGALSVGHSGIRRLGYGPVRDVLLQACYVSDGGEVVQAGGPTVKNVSGFDLCRLLVGARGTLGFIGDVIIRSRPRPAHSQWFTTEADDPFPTFTESVPPDLGVVERRHGSGRLLEGHPADVEAQAARCDAHALRRAAAAAVRRSPCRSPGMRSVR